MSRLVSNLGSGRHLYVCELFLSDEYAGTTCFRLANIPPDRVSSFQQAFIQTVSSMMLAPPHGM